MCALLAKATQVLSTTPAGRVLDFTFLSSSHLSHTWAGPPPSGPQTQGGPTPRLASGVLGVSTPDIGTGKPPQISAHTELVFCIAFT